MSSKITKLMKEAEALITTDEGDSNPQIAMLIRLMVEALRTVSATSKKATKSSTDDIENTIDNIACPEGVLDGCLYTKEKRQEMYGKVSGGRGSTEMERYQRKQIELGTGRPCPRTNIRINQETKEMVELAHPMLNEDGDGLDHTEDFDGKQTFNKITVYCNLKSVVGKGGSQMRTLRECHHFMKAQLEYLLMSNKTDCFFANIFDGDEASSKMVEFQNLLNKPRFETVKKYVYVGDLRGYFPWVKANVC